MDNKPTKPFLSKIDKFIASVERLNTNFFREAKVVGEELVALMRENDNTISILRDRIPRIPETYWKQLAAIGHGARPQKLLTACPGVERALRVFGDEPKKLAAILEADISVVVPDGNGGSVVQKKSIEHLSGIEARRLIRKGGTPPVEAQTATINHEKERREKPLRYTASNEGIQFHGSPFFTFAQLEDILKRHKIVALHGIESTIKKQQIDKRPRV